MYNSQRLMYAIGDLSDDKIEKAGRALGYQRTERRPARRPLRMGRLLSIAAVVALILALGVTIYAVYNGRLQDLVLNSRSENETETTESQSYDPLPEGVDTISLQGYTGSPEYMATLEWSEFLKNYDRDGEILASVGNAPTPWSEKYGSNNYLVYSQEMADTIDAIAAKYGLTLHTGFSVAGIDDLRERFGDFCSEIRYGSGYCYADGTFSCDSENSEGMFQIRRSMKGVLDTTVLNVGDIEQYEQWEYTTACGKTVLLALAPHHALILSESDQSFTVVNVMAGSEVSPSGACISATQLEALADSIDFSIL